MTNSTPATEIACVVRFRHASTTDGAARSATSRMAPGPLPSATASRSTLLASRATTRTSVLSSRASSAISRLSASSSPTQMMAAASATPAASRPSAASSMTTVVPALRSSSTIRIASASRPQTMVCPRILSRLLRKPPCCGTADPVASGARRVASSWLVCRSVLVVGFVGGGWDGVGVGSARLREWRGVKPVAAPSGVAIGTRLRTSAGDERVLDLVAEHVGRLRRADLSRVMRPQPADPSLDADARRQARRDRLNTRKAALTAESSARWANAIIAANDDQYRLARDAQYRHVAGLRAAIATIEKRLAAPTGDTLTVVRRKARRGEVRGYPTRAERFQKQRRLQHFRGELARVEAERAQNRVRVVEGGTRLAKTRHHLDTAGMTAAQWRDEWDATRYRITANGSGDEPFGNLTITVTPDGQVSIRLPKLLEHLTNAKRGRYVLSGRAVFHHRDQEGSPRITGGKSVSYTITRTSGRAGRYLTAAWATPAPTAPASVGGSPDDTVLAAGRGVGVD